MVTQFSKAVMWQKDHEMLKDVKRQLEHFFFIEMSQNTNEPKFKRNSLFAFYKIYEYLIEIITV